VLRALSREVIAIADELDVDVAGRESWITLE
jgi:hypothetical protein